MVAATTQPPIAIPTFERPRAARALGEIVVRNARPRRIRSMREFAEQEIFVQHGSRTVPFRVAAQPFSGVVFDELDSGHWYEAYITGPSQSAKTTVAHLIPAAHVICEHRENVVLGIPLDEMVDDKIRGNLLKMIASSPRLKKFLPEGWKGGRVKEKVTFSHGVEAKPMTRGSGDTGKAGYPARWVLVTEAADWSQTAATSPESDRLRQLKARQLSFPRSKRRLIVEGTTTNGEELPWRARGSDDEETLVSSRSLLVSPCPHCGAWISPEREHLHGWRDAKTEDQAAEQAYYVCPQCLHAITEEERRASVRHVKALHHGQTIDAQGDVQGPLPPTHTLWLRWTPWHNFLLSLGDVAVKEWQAAQIAEGTEERENAEKELCQFVFCQPFKSTLVEQEELDERKIRGRVDQWSRNVVPFDTQKLVMGVDVGKWRMHWTVLALREWGQVHVVAYGTWDVCHSENDDITTRILAAVAEINEQIVLPGFVREGTGEMWVPDLVVPDGRFESDAVAAALRAIGQGRWKSRWKMAFGVGRSTDHHKSGFHPKTKPTQQHPWLGVQWYAGPNVDRRVVEVSFNADYWKLWVHDRLRAKPGAKGALTLFKADNPNEHGKYTAHLVSEQLKRSWDPKKGNVEDWTKKGQNHWLDATAMAALAGDMLGWRLRNIAGPIVEEPTENEADVPPMNEPPRKNWYAEFTKRGYGRSSQRA